jgi:hypothetical protein
MIIPTSPNRLKIIAFIPAFHAISLEFQKLINKKEHKPTPSQPIKKIKKLLLTISIYIKKINKYRYDKNLTWYGSAYI